MSSRTTQRELQGVVDGLNRMVGAPLEAWQRDEQGHYVYGGANVGHYQIGAAYGGYRLELVINTSGGIRTITEYSTRRETLAAIRAYREGIAVAAGR